MSTTADLIARAKHFLLDTDFLANPLIADLIAALEKAEDELDSASEAWVNEIKVSARRQQAIMREEERAAMAEAERAELKARLESLQERFAKRGAEIAQVMKERDQAQAAPGAEIRFLRRELEEANKQNERLRRKVAELQKDRDYYRDVAESIKADWDYSVADARAWKVVAERYESDLRKAHERCGYLEARAERYEKRLREIAESPGSTEVKRRAMMALGEGEKP